MLEIFSLKKIWLARHRVDFRSSHDGLLAQVQRCNIPIFAGHGVLFIGRDRKKLKFIFADESGVLVLYKKFHSRGLKIKFEFLQNPSATKLTRKELQMLLSGASYCVGSRPAPWP